MARTPAQRGAFGEWLQRERSSRYKTQKMALAAYRKNAGLVIPPSEYAQWESGSRVPRSDNPKALRLMEFYGSSPEEPISAGEGRDTSSSPADLSELREALMSQAESMARMLQFAIRRDQSVEARIRAMEAELQSLRGRLGVEGSPTQSTPPQTGGSVD